MEAVTVDEDAGWAEFASFDSNEDATTKTGKEGPAHNLNEFATKDFASASSIVRDLETIDLLQGCFSNFKSDCTSPCTPDTSSCLENETSNSRVWKSCNEVNLELFPTMKWQKSSLQKCFMDTMKHFLETENSEEFLLPENLEVSSFVHCFNFHKFSHHGRAARSNKMVEKPSQNKNPAAEMNPFAPHKLQESDRCSSSNSISDKNSISSNNSVENFQVKEIDCMSVGSTDSNSSGIIFNGTCDAISDSRLLEKWKKVRSDCSKKNKQGLDSFSLEDLRTLSQELKQLCSTLSESLIKELRFKDGLAREKQLRDDFISLLLAISRKQKHQEVSQTSRRQRILFHVIGNVENNDKKFLDVSVPYLPTEDGPDLERIRSLTPILQAILDEDPKVTSLVTDYTMKVIKEMQETSQQR